MTFKTLMIIKAVVCLSLGIPILLAPAFVYSLIGTSIAAGGAFAAREYGASLMGNLMLAWFAKGASESEPRRAIALALCVYDAVGLVVTLIALLAGVLGPVGWVVAAIYLFFAVAFGSFLRPQKQVA